MSGSTDTVSAMSWPEVVARRLRRHRLVGDPTDGTPADIAEAVCGVHAQVMSAAELSVGLRGAALTRDDVRAALWTERTLVKGFGPRGTLHLLAARDLPMWTAALGFRPPAQAEPGGGPATDRRADRRGRRRRSVPPWLDEDLTIDELDERVVAATGRWAADPVLPAFHGYLPRWRQALPVAAMRGRLVFGPNRGRKVTYAHPARWLPGFRPARPGPALAELVRRYLHAYGPATPQHFAQWLAAPRGWAVELFDSLGDQLEPVDLDGDRLWRLAGDSEPSGPPEGIRLLPYFDAYAVGCHPRELVFPGRAAQRALAGGQSGNYPVLLIDGVVAGVWHQRRAGRRIEVTVEPLAPLTAAHRRDLDQQVRRIGEILDGTPRLTVGTVTVGPHA